MPAMTGSATPNAAWRRAPALSCARMCYIRLDSTRLDAPAKYKPTP